VCMVYVSTCYACMYCSVISVSLMIDPWSCDQESDRRFHGAHVIHAWTAVLFLFLWRLTLGHVIRNLIDDWMEHYRIAIGLQSPSLTLMSDSPRIRRRRQTQSAKALDGDKLQRRGMLGVEQKEAPGVSVRAPSAPSGGSFWL
jgi:hypothetical protein